MPDAKATPAGEGALIEECLDQRVWAVVGASTNPAKWGYRVYKALLARGYRVYPVNPRAKQIDGERCYPTLAELPETPDVVSVIIPPKLGLALADEAANAGITRLWFQPGAASPENVAHAQSLGLRVVAGACVLVELGSRESWVVGKMMLTARLRPSNDLLTTHDPRLISPSTARPLLPDGGR